MSERTFVLPKTFCLMVRESFVIMKSWPTPPHPVFNGWRRVRHSFTPPAAPGPAAGTSPSPARPRPRHHCQNRAQASPQRPDKRIPQSSVADEKLLVSGYKRVLARHRKDSGEHPLHRAVADGDLTGIDARGGDPDQNLPVSGRGTRGMEDAQDVRLPVMAELNPAAHWCTSGAGASWRVSAMTGIVRLVFSWYPANPG